MEIPLLTIHLKRKDSSTLSINICKNDNPLQLAEDFAVANKFPTAIISRLAQQIEHYKNEALSNLKNGNDDPSCESKQELQNEDRPNEVTDANSYMAPMSPIEAPLLIKENSKEDENNFANPPRRSRSAPASYKKVDESMNHFDRMYSEALMSKIRLKNLKAKVESERKKTIIATSFR